MDPKKNSPNKKNGDNKKNKNLKGFLTLVAWALVLTVALNFLSAYAGNRSNKSTSHEVDYSQLWQLVEEDKITDVIFENNTVYATPVEGYVFTDDKGKEYTHTKDSVVVLYTTNLGDDDLYALLREHDVDYTEPYKAPMSCSRSRAYRSSSPRLVV